MANYYPAFINHVLPEINTILRAGEVACYLDISKSSVFRSIQNGKIPARRFGNSVWILRVDILAFENGAGIIPAITRMETNMGKKKSPRSCVGGGQEEYQPGNPQYLVRFNSNTPRRKGKGDCSKKKININYQINRKF